MFILSNMIPGNFVLVPNVTGEGAWGPFADENREVADIVAGIYDGGERSTETMYQIIE